MKRSKRGGIGRSALALKEKKLTEEPSAGERPIHIIFSLIASFPMPTVHVAYLQIAYLQISCYLGWRMRPTIPQSH